MPKAQVQSKIVRVSDLSADLRRRMFQLFERYYVDVNFDEFSHDLSEKTHCFLFWSNDELVGFSTIFRKRIPEVAPGVFLFSGDTVLQEAYWGTKILQKAFFRYIVESKIRSLNEPLYWMLISKGYKTYLMMRKNFAQSYPARTRPTPSKYEKILNAFYGWKYPRHYNPKSHLIDFGRNHGAVKGKIAFPTEDRMSDPEVKYFMEHNPNFHEGIELACLAEILWSDFLGHIPKYFLRPFSRTPRNSTALLPSVKGSEKQS
jgi:hypothetical protein